VRESLQPRVISLTATGAGEEEEVPLVKADSSGTIHRATSGGSADKIVKV
jgi:hypothetical protein